VLAASEQCLDKIDKELRLDSTCMGARACLITNRSVGMHVIIQMSSWEFNPMNYSLFPEIESIAND
jgi:hypothetical protein